MIYYKQKKRDHVARYSNEYTHIKIYVNHYDIPNVPKEDRDRLSRTQVLIA